MTPEQRRPRLNPREERRLVRAGIQRGQGKPQTIETRPALWCINRLFAEVS